MLDIIKAEFCKECKNFIKLPLSEDYISCTRCGTRTNIKEFEFKSISTSKDYSNIKKDWLEDYKKNMKNDNKIQKIKNDGLDIIEQPCINDNCNSNSCYYTARQMRSADEGQTVFYQCIECGERFTLNN